jgi:N-acetylneuraminic acid mutarotase
MFTGGNEFQHNGNNKHYHQNLAASNVFCVDWQIACKLTMQSLYMLHATGYNPSFSIVHEGLDPRAFLAA